LSQEDLLIVSGYLAIEPTSDLDMQALEMFASEPVF